MKRSQNGLSMTAIIVLLVTGLVLGIMACAIVFFLPPFSLI